MSIIKTTWKMDYRKSCKWESTPIHDALIDVVPCVIALGASDKTCGDCSFRKEN